MERAGADLLDIGGRIDRPGSTETPADTELARVLPVLEGLRGVLKIPISVDTRKSEVAEAAITAGAQIINDVSGLRSDPRIAEVAVRRGVPLILMHMRGEPATMQKKPFARDVMKDVCKDCGRRSLRRDARACTNRKSSSTRASDSAKNFEQNYELLRKLADIANSAIRCWLARRGGISRRNAGA